MAEVVISIRLQGEMFRSLWRRMTAYRDRLNAGQHAPPAEPQPATPKPAEPEPLPVTRKPPKPKRSSSRSTPIQKPKKET